MNATYSPEDNKLRLYPDHRLPEDEYRRVKDAGFSWAPKQELFVAPMWTPKREDLLIDLCGEVGDEDTSLVERAEARADRFRDYSHNRAAEADQAHAAVESICNGIPLGQPILVGHHSERHARKDAERIENGMRRAISLWETSEYWKQRARGAIHAAKYKERPDVRARRIKKLEAELRSHERIKAKAEEGLKCWTRPGLTLEQAIHLAGSTDHGRLSLPRKEGDRPDWSYRPSAYDGLSNCSPTLYAPRTLEEVVAAAREAYPKTIDRCDRWIQHYLNRLEYERAMLAEDGGLTAQKHELEVGGQVLVGGEWQFILRVNKTHGVVNSVTTTPPKVVHWRKDWKYGAEEIRDYRPPTAEQSDKVKAATKLPPLCNYPGKDFLHITQQQWDDKNKDYKGSTVLEATDKYDRHRVRHGMFQACLSGLLTKPETMKLYHYGPAWIPNQFARIPEGLSRRCGLRQVSGEPALAQWFRLP